MTIITTQIFKNKHLSTCLWSSAILVLSMYNYKTVSIQCICAPLTGLWHILATNIKMTTKFSREPIRMLFLWNQLVLTVFS